MATCQVRGEVLALSECVSEHGKKACEDLQGKCVMERDGYYYVSSICVALGIVTLIFYIIPTARRLQGWFLLVLLSWLYTHCVLLTALPTSKWRVNLGW